MTNYTTGADALNALNTEQGNDKTTEFASFKSGSTYVVKVLGTANLISFFSYGIYGKLNSFVAANPSKKSAKGYPVENLTPFDKAWKYHKDLSSDFSDKHGQEASKYRAKQRFALGFYDLTSGQPIIVDVSKPQAKAIMDVINKYAKKLDKLAFELSKSGSGTSTVVSLSPILDLDEDITPEQRANFDKAPAEFDMSLFDGLLFEVDEATQVQFLTQVGFDVANIGYSKTVASEEAPSTGDIPEEELPF